MNAVKILDCGAGECAFNDDGQCHAKAITVGNSASHTCDTFFSASTKGGALEVIGEVGACKESSCKFNDRFLCIASGIHVGHEGDTADCLSFDAG